MISLYAALDASAHANGRVLITKLEGPDSGSLTATTKDVTSDLQVLSATVVPVLKKLVPFATGVWVVVLTYSDAESRYKTEYVQYDSAMSKVLSVVLDGSMAATSIVQAWSATGAISVGSYHEVLEGGESGYTIITASGLVRGVEKYVDTEAGVNNLIYPTVANTFGTHPSLLYHFRNTAYQRKVVGLDGVTGDENLRSPLLNDGAGDDTGIGLPAVWKLYAASDTVLLGDMRNNSTPAIQRLDLETGLFENPISSVTASAVHTKVAFDAMNGLLVDLTTLTTTAVASPGPSAPIAVGLTRFVVPSSTDVVGIWDTDLGGYYTVSSLLRLPGSGTAKAKGAVPPGATDYTGYFLYYEDGTGPSPVQAFVMTPEGAVDVTSALPADFANTTITEADDLLVVATAVPFNASVVDPCPPFWRSFFGTREVALCPTEPAVELFGNTGNGEFYLGMLAPGSGEALATELTVTTGEFLDEEGSINQQLVSVGGVIEYTYTNQTAYFTRDAYVSLWAGPDTGPATVTVEKFDNGAWVFLMEVPVPEDPNSRGVVVTVSTYGSLPMRFTCADSAYRIAITDIVQQFSG